MPPKSDQMRRFGWEKKCLIKLSEYFCLLKMLMLGFSSIYSFQIRKFIKKHRLAGILMELGTKNNLFSTLIPMNGVYQVFMCVKVKPQLIWMLFCGNLSLRLSFPYLRLICCYLCKPATSKMDSPRNVIIYCVCAIWARSSPQLCAQAYKKEAHFAKITKHQKPWFYEC